MATAKKLGEWVAHGGAVNCLHIGRRSGSVLATGSDDKKVNIWSLGKQNALMSLSGHTSAVECVSFDSNEQTVIAGSAGGTLKLWDLEQAKVARTLTGHLSNCISVQWHPYGEFFASGSVDTNLKIWDIRRKLCIQTYKGHARGVRQIIFSPDGRWVVSGGDDGVVKLWDLTAGRQVHEFTQHSAPITGLAIHPTEFLMASASADRTLRLWDLESFEQVCCFPPESSQPRRVQFSDDGSALLSGSEDSLKVWGWEPVRCQQQTQTRWSRLADMFVGPNDHVIAGSVQDSMVSVWSMDLSLSSSTGDGQFASHGRAATPSAASPAVIRSEQHRSPGGCSPASLSAMNGSPNMAAKGAPHICANPHPHDSIGAAGSRDTSDPQSLTQCARMQIAQCRAQLAKCRRESHDTEPSGKVPSLGDASRMEPAEGMGARGAFEPQAVPAPPKQPSLSSSGNHASVGTSMTDTLLGDPRILHTRPEGGQHMAKVGGVIATSTPKADASMRPDEGAMLSELTKQSHRQRACLDERLAALRALQRFWQAGEVKIMLQHLHRLNDTSVSVDVVRAGIMLGGKLDLECVLIILPTLSSLLKSTYDEHVLAAIEAATHVVSAFGHLIRNTRAIPTDRVGVDLSAEARQQRCQACYEQLASMVPALTKLSKANDTLSKPAAAALVSFSRELGFPQH